MKKIKYIIEATEDSYTESLSYDGTTVSKTWRRTEAGMKCEQADLSKQLEQVGDIFITGVVGGSSCREVRCLQSVRLASVMHLADCICDGIQCAEAEFLQPHPADILGRTR